MSKCHKTQLWIPAVTVVVAVLLFACRAGLARAADWTTYRNERYGFSLEYPPDLFVLAGTTEAGDGQSFINSQSGAKLLVGVLPNGSNFTPRSYQDYLAAHTYAGFKLKYRKAGRSWMALSGENSDKIFYEKMILGCGGRLINSFAMVYPTARRAEYDPVVERIEESFRAGTICEGRDRVSTGSKQPRQRRTSAHRSTRALPGTRSALADRIARERGRNVIVILRRTTPPYDRKIVHGYASSR